MDSVVQQPCDVHSCKKSQIRVSELQAGGRQLNRQQQERTLIAYVPGRKNWRFQKQYTLKIYKIPRVPHLSEFVK